MAADKELNELAFRIYAEAVAGSPMRKDGGERVAIEAFRRAEAFIAVRKKMEAGELKPKPPEGPQLADCCCPNLHRTHPLNLVARTYTSRHTGESFPGDLAKVQRIQAWLAKNPVDEEHPEKIVGLLNRQFPELGWDMPMINTARAVFPAYCTNGNGAH